MHFSVTLRPQSDCCHRGEAEVGILDFKTTWSEFQMPSQTAPAEAKPRYVYSILKPHGQSFRRQVRPLLSKAKPSYVYTILKNITSPESVPSSCVRQLPSHYYFISISLLSNIYSTNRSSFFHFYFVTTYLITISASFYLLFITISSEYHLYFNSVSSLYQLYFFSILLTLKHHYSLFHLYSYLISSLFLIYFVFKSSKFHVSYNNFHAKIENLSKYDKMCFKRLKNFQNDGP